MPIKHYPNDTNSNLTPVYLQIWVGERDVPLVHGSQNGAHALYHIAVHPFLVVQSFRLREPIGVQNSKKKSLIFFVKILLHLLQHRGFSCLARSSKKLDFF